MLLLNISTKNIPIIMTQAKTSRAARAHPTQSCKLLISNPANTSILIFETAYIMFNFIPFSSGLTTNLILIEANTSILILRQV